MIDTCQWRIAIGLWYCHQIPYTTKKGTTIDISGWVKSLWSGYEGGGNLVLFFLLLILSGDIELNPGPKTDKSTPSELFRTHSADLSGIITPILTSVTNVLYAKELIPFEVKTNILSITGEDDLKKSSKLVGVLQRQLQAHKDPHQYLVNICHVLRNELKQHERIKDVVTLILQQLEEEHITPACQILHNHFDMNVAAIEKEQTVTVKIKENELESAKQKDGASKMASSEFTTEWNTLVPQQQCFVITSETTETESISHQDKVKPVSSINKFPTQELASKARHLKMKFYDLLSAIEISSKQKNVETFKFNVQVLLTDAQESPQLTTTIYYLNEVKQLETSSDVLLFLKMHGFIGYQNYELLEYIVGCLLKDDLQVVTQMDEYIEKYEDFEQHLSLNELEEISREEDLQPRAPSGFPKFALRANGDTNVHQWKKTYSEKFPWSNRTLLKELNPCSIVMTYVALPCVVSNILRDLTDPVILSELESIGVTVVLLPQCSDTSELSLSSFVESEHVQDNMKQSVQMICDLEEPLLDPISTQEPLLDSVAIKEPLLDPVSTQDATMSSQDNIESNTLVQDNGQQLVLHSIQYDNTLDEPLLTAVRKNNISEVNKLLESYANPNCFEKDGYNAPLHIAVDNGNNDIVKALLSMGANINMTTKGYWKETPLQIAIRKQDKIIVQSLLLMKADPNINESIEDKPPLLDVVESEKIDIIEVLLSAGANPNITSRFGNRAPLHVAVKKGNDDIVKTLLLNGADPNITSNDGTPLCIAFKSCNDDIFQILLLNGAEPIATFGCDKEALLHHAARQGFSDVVQVLLDKGVEVNVVDNSGRTVLHSAAEGGNVDIIKTLLAKGYDPNIKDKDGYTALHVVTTFNSTVAVQALLDGGACPNIVSNDGTPLCLAIISSKNDIVYTLLFNGADPNVTFGQDNKTPLHHAAKQGDSDIVQILLDKGAKVNVVDNNGRTVLYCAAEGGKKTIIKRLLAKGCDPNIKDKNGDTALHAVTNSSAAVQALLDGGANLNTMNNNGQTPLHLAAKWFHDDIIRILLNYGANPNIVGTEGRTALHYAAERGDVDIIKILLNKGCNPNTQDKYGNTALHVLMTLTTVDGGSYMTRAIGDGTFNDIVRTLLQCGTNPAIVNNNGQKPEDMIKSHRKKRIFKTLFEKYTKSLRDITTVPLSPDDNPSTYSTTYPKSIHESPTYSEPIQTELLEDPQISSDWSLGLQEGAETQEETTRPT